MVTKSNNILIIFLSINIIIKIDYQVGVNI